jgi:transforming growth factor-beta-induced protein
MNALISFLLLALVVGAVSAQTTVLQVLAQEPEYSQVYATIEGKPIETLLNESSANLTFLAPVNQPKALNLTNDQLDYHTLNGSYIPNNPTLKDGQLLVTSLSLSSLANGYQRIKVSVEANNTVFLGPNKAKFNATGLAGSNGIIHGVETPIDAPSNLGALAQSVPTLSTLVGVLNTAGIQLANLTAVTAFAPTNDAFSQLQTNPSTSLVYKYLVSSDGLADLRNILTYHVATQVVYSDMLQPGFQSVPSANGQSLNVTVNGTSVTVDNANVISVDNLASNGVAHIIDRVLIPNNFEFTVRKALIGLNRSKFVEALVNATLAGYLNSSESYYFFAPPDSVFEGKQIPASVLKYHLAARSEATLPVLLASELELSAANNARQPLKVVSGANNVTTVNGVVLSAPVVIGNSVIYTINTAFAPPSKSIVQTAADGDFSRLVTAVTLAGVAGVLQDTTVFAPTNEAFSGPVADYLLLNTTESNTDLINVLKYHVAAGNNVYYNGGSPQLPATVTTLNGDVAVTFPNGTVVLNGKTEVVAANILASNGVIHAIDSVLVPSNFVLNNDKLVQGFRATDFLSRLSQANLTTNVLTTGTFTIFAFTDTAYDRAPKELTSNPSRWPNVIKTHIFNGTIASLVAGANYTMLSGEVLEVVSATSVQVRGAEGAGKPTVVGGPVATSNGVVYLIDGILSIKSESSDSSGLSDTAIGFIVIGCIIGVLLIIGAAGGGYWYYRRRAGYEQIGDNAF